MIETRTATILSGQTVSNAVQVPGGYALAAIKLPAALTGASITFRSGAETITIQNTNANRVITFAATKHVPLSVAEFVGAPSLAVVSAASEAADRVFTLVFVHVLTATRGF